MAKTAEQLFLLTSVADTAQREAEATIRRLLDHGWYVFTPRTPGLDRFKAGDRLCFYKKQAGIVAEVMVAGAAEKKSTGLVDNEARFPWAVPVKSPRYFFSKPVPLDATLRTHLDAFRGKDATQNWAWIVQSPRLVSEHDFNLLVGRRTLK